MKHILVLISFFVASLCFSQGIEFYHGSFEEALEKAKNEEKLIFIDAYASWCGPCKRMSSTVFTQAVVGEYFNKTFINMKIDMEQGEGPVLSKMFGVTAYPTLIFISPKGEIVQKHVGGMDPDGFVEFAKTVSGKADFSADFVKEYDKGNRDPEFILKYVTSMNKSGKSPLKVANDYLATQSNFTSDNNLKIIHQAAVECDSRIFDLMIKNKKQIINLVGKEAFQAKVKEAGENTVDKAIEFQVTDLLEQAKLAVKENDPDDTDAFNYESDMKYFKSTGNIEAYSKASLNYAQKFLKKDGEKLFNLASELEAHDFDKPEAMEAAEKISALSIKSSPKSEYYLLYARLLERNRKIKPAIKTCEEGLKIAGNDYIAKQKFEDYIQLLKKK